MKRKKGFTLVELLVIVGIIVILAVIELVQVNEARLRSLDSSFQSTVTNTHRALALCCSTPNMPLGVSLGDPVCAGGDQYPDDTKMTFVSVFGCSMTGSFTVVLTPGTENAGNCTEATLTEDRVEFEGC